MVAVGNIRAPRADVPRAAAWRGGHGDRLFAVSSVPRSGRNCSRAVRRGAVQRPSAGRAAVRCSRRLPVPGLPPHEGQAGVSTILLLVLFTLKLLRLVYLVCSMWGLYM